VPPVRALIASWEYPPVIEGGLGRHVRKLSEHLVREGAEVHVLTRRGGNLPAEEVLSDDAGRARAVAAAREHVLQFDWRAVARETHALYASVAAGAPAHS
jgi:hypothetical protein